MSEHLRGLLITTLGVLLVVPDSLFVRLIYAEPMVIAFWRSLISGIFVLFIVIALCFIAYGSTTVQIASWKGDIWAVYVSVAFAAALTAVRSARAVSMIPAIPLGYIGGALVLSFFIAPFEVQVEDWKLILMHGTIIGASSCLLTLGPRFISSSEVSLLVLLESVLAPILVWFVLGEYPGQYAILGGCIVVSALSFFNLFNLYKLKKV